MQLSSAACIPSASLHSNHAHKSAAAITSNVTGNAAAAAAEELQPQAANSLQPGAHVLHHQAGPHAQQMFSELTATSSPASELPVEGKLRFGPLWSQAGGTAGLTPSGTDSSAKAAPPLPRPQGAATAHTAAGEVKASAPVCFSGILHAFQLCACAASKLMLLHRLSPQHWCLAGSIMCQDKSAVTHDCAEQPNRTLCAALIGTKRLCMQHRGRQHVFLCLIATTLAGLPQCAARPDPGQRPGERHSPRACSDVTAECSCKWHTGAGQAAGSGCSGNGSGREQSGWTAQ